MIRCELELFTKVWWKLSPSLSLCLCLSVSLSVSLSLSLCLSLSLSLSLSLPPSLSLSLSVCLSLCLSLSLSLCLSLSLSVSLCLSLSFSFSFSLSLSFMLPLGDLSNKKALICNSSQSRFHVVLYFEKCQPQWSCACHLIIEEICGTTDFLCSPDVNLVSVVVSKKVCYHRN